ncbi:TPA: hypothetical protein NJQ39_000305 [Staphylococcus aureus]|nr:hypothetical protein [Staphylococcus aureus]HCG2751542.1 hypothetical protein [Staphylococcus aureus]
MTKKTVATSDNKDTQQQNQSEEDERQGLNGYRKTDLDLEIEQELREMMKTGENETENDYKKFKVFSLISTLIIVILAIIRFVHKMM